MLEVGKGVRVARVVIASRIHEEVRASLLGVEGTIIDSPDEGSGDPRWKVGLDGGEIYSFHSLELEVIEETKETRFCRSVLAAAAIRRSNMTRINLTRHYARPDQECAARTAGQTRKVRELLTFEDVPTPEELITRAHQLAAIARKAGATEAMIDGPSCLVLALDRILREVYILPVYAFKETTIEL